MLNLQTAKAKVKSPSIEAVWRMLESDYSVVRPILSARIKMGETAEVGDFNESRNAFPVWVHVCGAAYPEKYWYEASRGKL